MANTIHWGMIRKLIAVSLVLGGTSAQAQNCKKYPPGPARFQCAQANHPEVVAKKERCRGEAQAMGLHGTMRDPVRRQYMQACMQRR
jgi:hypothetical protein